MDTSLSYLRRAASIRVPRALIVLLHGLGSNEQDLFSFSQYLDPTIEVVSLRAPHPYGGPSGYKWFSLDIGPTGVKYDVSEAQDSLTKVVEAIRGFQEESDLCPEKTILAGFSQGAMLATSILLQEKDLIGAAWLMSGAVIPEISTPCSERLGKVNALVQHGISDDVVPVARGREIQKVLSHIEGVSAEMREYPMGHSVSEESLADALEWIEQLYR